MLEAIESPGKLTLTIVVAAKTGVYSMSMHEENNLLYIKNPISLLEMHVRQFNRFLRMDSNVGTINVNKLRRLVKDNAVSLVDSIVDQ